MWAPNDRRARRETTHLDMKRLSFARAAALPVLCAAALLAPQAASATVEARIVDGRPPAGIVNGGGNAQPPQGGDDVITGSRVADAIAAGLPAARVISARRLASSQRLPDQVDQLNRSERARPEGALYAGEYVLAVNAKVAPLDNPKIKQALSLAIDRKAYIDTLYKGYALTPRTLANPGTWGYERDVFQKDWDALPDPALNVAKGKQLVQQAGATGKTIVIGTSSEINSLQTAANAVRQAAISIGLKARLKSVSAANYINFFTDAKARAGVDGFLTVNYPDYADPAALYNTLVMPGGSQNYDNFNDPRITAAMNEARTTTDQHKRAQLTAKAGDLIMQTLPWIPLADPDTVLVMDKRITGAPSSFQYMGGPWAASIGAAG
jgi:peptide/nickel transport system substrate-binding protein